MKKLHALYASLVAMVGLMFVPGLASAQTADLSDVADAGTSQITAVGPLAIAAVVACATVGLLIAAGWKVYGKSKQAVSKV